MYNAELHTYCMSKSELSIVLAIEKFDGFIGFSSKKKISQTDLMQNLVQLATKQMVTVEEKTITLNKTYSDLLEPMKMCKTCLILDGCLERKKCCYISDNVLITELSDIKPDEIIMYQMKSDEFEKILCETMHVNETKQIKDQVCDAQNMQEIMENGVEEYRLELYVKNKKECSILGVNEQQEHWLFVEKQDKKEMLHCHDENVKKIINYIMKGKEE